MGNSKGSKLKKGERGKQIHGDPSGNKKGSKPQNKMKKMQIDRKARIFKKQCTELFIKYFEVRTGKTVPYTQVKKTGEIQRPWAEVFKMLVEHFNCLQAEHQTQASFMEQQEVEKAEHVTQSTKLMVVEAAIRVEMTESMIKQLQDYFLKEDKTDQGLNPKDQQTTAFLGSPVPSSDLAPLPEDFFEGLEIPSWMEEDLMPGTSSGAGTSTAMTSTGEGEYQNNGVNETFGVE